MRNTKPNSEAVIGRRGADIKSAKNRMFLGLQAEIMNLVRNTVYHIGHRIFDLYRTIAPVRVFRAYDADLSKPCSRIFYLDL